METGSKTNLFTSFHDLDTAFSLKEFPLTEDINKFGVDIST